MAVCCQNLTLGAFSGRSALSELAGALSELAGALFEKVRLFLKTPLI
jgi:hypothetical protein